MAPASTVYTNWNVWSKRPEKWTNGCVKACWMYGPPQATMQGCIATSAPVTKRAEISPLRYFRCEIEHIQQETVLRKTVGFRAGDCSWRNYPLGIWLGQINFIFSYLPESFWLWLLYLHNLELVLRRQICSLACVDGASVLLSTNALIAVPKRQIACGKWCNTGTALQYNYSHSGLPQLSCAWTPHRTIFFQIGTKED